MTWSDRLLSLLAPPMEPSQDPRIEVRARLKAKARRRRIRRERRARLERYALTWEAEWAKQSKDPAKVMELRPRMHLCREQRVG